jgi:hypothetical protein
VAGYLDPVSVAAFAFTSKFLKSIVGTAPWQLIDEVTLGDEDVFSRWLLRTMPRNEPLERDLFLKLLLKDISGKDFCMKCKIIHKLAEEMDVLRYGKDVCSRFLKACEPPGCRSPLFRRDMKTAMTLYNQGLPCREQLKKLSFKENRSGNVKGSGTPDVRQIGHHLEATAKIVLGRFIFRIQHRYDFGSGMPIALFNWIRGGKEAPPGPQVTICTHFQHKDKGKGYYARCSSCYDRNSFPSDKKP